MSHKLEVDSIQLELSGRRLLSDIYLKSETGKITGLLGKNGVGKSSLMNIIYGSLKCEKSVRFDTIAIPQPLTQPGLLRYLPQYNFIPGSLSLKDIFDDFNLDFSSFAKRFLEFRNLYKSSVKHLSQGNQRLVEIYIIVKSESQFVLLDEPFTHLSPIHIEKIQELIIEEKQYKGFIITDHMFRYVTAISDDLYVLTNGKTYLTKDIAEIESHGYVRFNGS